MRGTRNGRPRGESRPTAAIFLVPVEIEGTLLIGVLDRCTREMVNPLGAPELDVPLEDLAGLGFDPRTLTDRFL